MRVQANGFIKGGLPQEHAQTAIRWFDVWERTG
jgi:hypothetical protein